MKENTLRVLLIEDDEDDYILTSELLEEVKGTKYEITWVSKYTDALKAMGEGGHDVFLIDYRLGEGNGIELMREAVARGCRAPMILLTGQGDKEIDFEATKAGAADYLTKGKIEAQLLERAIRYAIAHGRTLETLRESENRFRSVVESANDAIILTDYQGKIFSWNKSAQTIFGYAQSEILGKSLSVLFPPSYHHNSGNDNESDPLLASGLLHPGSKAIELTGLTQGGHEFPLEISLSSWKTAEGIFYSGIIRDITERKTLEDQLMHQALHDPLTKLANRVLFRNRVEHALQRVERHRAPLAVLFLDLDNFKTVNDTLGHAAGDELLLSVAERLQACLRTSDTAARLGGDEFAILIENTTNTDGAVLVAERIKDILHSSFSICGNEVFVGTSIGIATTVTGSENPDELLRNADTAMYMAKNQGKNRYVVFENEMHEALIKRVRLEADLRQAIEREEFVLHYQPIVDLRSERMIGMEALVRWNHPERGLIPPLEFIPVAEETNLIVPLGRWILDEACRQASAWQTQYNGESWLSITVNISGRQFQQNTFVKTVAATLAKSGLAPHSLILEITENTVLGNTEAMSKKLREIKDLGVRLAIDDFGTGYSSLGYLQRFPVDILKIDKSFIDKIDHGKEGAAVARAIITMGENLHLKTIAEGIETPEQIAALQNLGCELGQGYHFAKPLNKEDMNRFLSKANLARQKGWSANQIIHENMNSLELAAT
jgi:diguanylate cyclase (GGDEF)-like protein/PAS domain S-box-containing protein